MEWFFEIECLKNIVERNNEGWLASRGQKRRDGLKMSHLGFDKATQFRL